MRNLSLAVLAFAAAFGANAKDVEVNPASCAATCQPEFDAIVEDVIATVDYKAMGPAEAGGLTGFGIGAVVSYVPVDNEEAWRRVTGQEFSALGIAGVQVTKGLPFNIDLGAFYTTVPDTNVDVYGAEVRYAILPGSTTSPALALRGSYVAVTGIESFDVESTSVDLSLSKGLTVFTPYVGVGYVMGTADPDEQTTAATGLRESEVEDTKAYLGLRMSLGLFEITPEVAQVGDNVTYNLRLGFSI